MSLLLLQVCKNLQYTNTYIVLILNQYVQVPKRDPAKECGVFGVLLIGDTSSGKPALIKNLLAAELPVATEGHTCRSETDRITQYLGTVAGVPVALYDTPGTDETDRDICKKVKMLFKAKKVCLVISAFK